MIDEIAGENILLYNNRIGFCSFNPPMAIKKIIKMFDLGMTVLQNVLLVNFHHAEYKQVIDLFTWLIDANFEKYHIRNYEYVQGKVSRSNVFKRSHEQDTSKNTHRLSSTGYENFVFDFPNEAHPVFKRQKISNNISPDQFNLTQNSYSNFHGWPSPPQQSTPSLASMNTIPSSSDQQYLRRQQSPASLVSVNAIPFGSVQQGPASQSLASLEGNGPPSGSDQQYLTLSTILSQVQPTQMQPLQHMQQTQPTQPGLTTMHPIPISSSFDIQSSPPSLSCNQKFENLDFEDLVDSDSCRTGKENDLTLLTPHVRDEENDKALSTPRVRDEENDSITSIPHVHEEENNRISIPHDQTASAPRVYDENKEILPQKSQIATNSELRDYIQNFSGGESPPSDHTNQIQLYVSDENGAIVSQVGTLPKEFQFDDPLTSLIFEQTNSTGSGRTSGVNQSVQFLDPSVQNTTPVQQVATLPSPLQQLATIENSNSPTSMTPNDLDSLSGEVVVNLAREFAGKKISVEINELLYSIYMCTELLTKRNYDQNKVKAALDVAGTHLLKLADERKIISEVCDNLRDALEAYELENSYTT